MSEVGESLKTKKWTENTPADAAQCFNDQDIIEKKGNMNLAVWRYFGCLKYDMKQSSVT